MPPEISHSHSHSHSRSHLSAITPKTPLLSQLSPKSRFKQIQHQKGGGRMKFTKRKIIPLLVFILCSASIFRFRDISMITISSAPHLPPIYQHKNVPSTTESTPTQKEMKFLMEFFSHRVPCNLLVFGPEYQYSSIASLNDGGFTIFLEDHLQKKSTTKSTNSTQVHKIKYNTVASEAYRLLKDARENPDCWPKFHHQPEGSNCSLALSNLPQKVFNTTWDVVVVDGPRGRTPDSPGRMASIYTASLLARRGNMTHVIVHDVNRMIEKWFSWEFLCEENLVSSKGRFWHFQAVVVTNATKFCTP